MSLSSEHFRYLKERGTNPERLATRYCSSGSDLRILYCDPTGQRYLDQEGDTYVVRRLFPSGKPKFVAQSASGSRPYFRSLRPDGYLEDINIPLVLIEGPVKVGTCC